METDIRSPLHVLTLGQNLNIKMDKGYKLVVTFFPQVTFPRRICPLCRDMQIAKLQITILYLLDQYRSYLLPYIYTFFHTSRSNLTSLSFLSSSPPLSGISYKPPLTRFPFALYSSKFQSINLLLWVKSFAPMSATANNMHGSTFFFFGWQCLRLPWYALCPHYIFFMLHYLQPGTTARSKRQQTNPNFRQNHIIDKVAVIIIKAISCHLMTFLSEK